MSSPSQVAAGFTITGLLDGASRTRGRYPVSEIAVADIADHPANAAYSMDPAGIAELAESIRQDGLTDLPLVRKLDDGGWQMVSGHLAGLDVPEALLDELAADAVMMPSSFEAARRLVTLCADESPEQVVRAGVAAARRLLHGASVARRRRPAIAFDVAFLNLAGGIAPGRLAGALARSGRGALCFYGPPGTGKTEFAHVLAEALDRELVVKASSDLVSPYVGETERNLARLFNDFDVEHGILLLDEVDSLLRDRGQARHGWELTQVNELLQQMERFDGLFIAATNRMSGLDAAAMRRFDFKLEFRPLNEAQRLALFAREVFGDADEVGAIPPPLARRLVSLDRLTPGDFANVVRQHRLLDEVPCAEDFLRRLMLECRHKAGVDTMA